MARDEPKTRKRVKPELPGGFIEFLPGEALQRRWMLDIMRGVVESFGFLPIETPCIERYSVLSGGDPNFRMQIFRIAGRDDAPIALRFDQTVPLARYVAAHAREIVLPFRRWVAGPVFRAESTQAGRYNEFWQFDFDTVGTSTVMSDAETITVIYSIMRALIRDGFCIRVNNRKLVNGLPAYAGFDPAKIDGVLRAIDKLDRDGWERVELELRRPPDNDFDEAALNLTEENVAAIRRFLDIRNGSHEQMLEQAEALLRDSEVSRQGIAELRQIVALVRAYGIPDANWSIDFSVTRGLGYYTGPVFETVVAGAESMGSVCSGGRFDNLVENFSATPCPGTGASVGVDRLFAVMRQLRLLPKTTATAKVLIAVIDSSLLGRYCTIATALRAAGIPTEIYGQEGKSMTDQIAFALKRGIPFMVILGGDEAARGTIAIRNLSARVQDQVRLEDLVPALTALVG